MPLHAKNIKKDRWYSLRCATENCTVKECGTPECPIEEEYKTCANCCECMDTAFVACCDRCIRGEINAKETRATEACRDSTGRTTRSYRTIK